MLLVVGGIRDLMEMAADRGLRLVRFRPDNAVEPFLAFADVRITTEEVHRAGTETEQLGHPGIVVVVRGEVAIRAVFRCPDATRGMREMRIERLAAVTFRRDGLGLRVNPFTILIL